jgi:hypothetical protein
MKRTTAADTRAPRPLPKPRLPRAPLPKQTGGAHLDKTRRPWRERKHKGAPEDE